MIILDATNKKLSVDSNLIAALSVSTLWVDDDTTATSSSTIATVDSDTIDIVPVPGSSVVRAVKKIKIKNTSIGLPAQVIVNKMVAATPTQLYKTFLGAGETLKFDWDRGWFRLDEDGINVSEGEDVDNAMIVDSTTDVDFVWTCTGLPGAKDTDPVWKIQRYEKATGLILWADGNNRRDNIAANRTGLTYGAL